MKNNNVFKKKQIPNFPKNSFSEISKFFDQFSISGKLRTLLLTKLFTRKYKNINYKVVV